MCFSLKFDKSKLFSLNFMHFKLFSIRHLIFSTLHSKLSKKMETQITFKLSIYLTNFLFQVPAAVEVDKLVKEATKACYDDYLAKMPNVN
jgi:hypothetical protein